ELAELFVDSAQVGQGLDVLRLRGNGVLIGRERFFEPSGPLQHNAEIKAIQRMIRMLPNRTAEQLARKVELAGAVGKKTQSMQCLRVFRAHLEDEPIGPFGFSQTTGLVVALRLAQERGNRKGVP